MSLPLCMVAQLSVLMLPMVEIGMPARQLKLFVTRVCTRHKLPVVRLHCWVRQREALTSLAPLLSSVFETVAPVFGGRLSGLPQSEQSSLYYLADVVCRANHMNAQHANAQDGRGNSAAGSIGPQGRGRSFSGYSTGHNDDTDTGKSIAARQCAKGWVSWPNNWQGASILTRVHTPHICTQSMVLVVLVPCALIYSANVVAVVLTGGNGGDDGVSDAGASGMDSDADGSKRLKRPKSLPPPDRPLPAGASADAGLRWSLGTKWPGLTVFTTPDTRSPVRTTGGGVSLKRVNDESDDDGVITSAQPLPVSSSATAPKASMFALSAIKVSRA